MGRPTKENSLSRQDIVKAAIACIDHEGISALGVSSVARSLGIKPPALYKHFKNGADLQRATVIELWRQYLAECQRTVADQPIDSGLLKQLGYFPRWFAKAYPARYQAMMQIPLQPSDPEAGEIIQQLLGFLRQALSAYDLSDTQLIDAMRMLNAAIYGFISVEQTGLMTLDRSIDESYDAMLDMLIAAVEQI